MKRTIEKKTRKKPTKINLQQQKN